MRAEEETEKQRVKKLEREEKNPRVVTYMKSHQRSHIAKAAEEIDGLLS